eukprot:EG_transcript_40247
MAAQAKPLNRQEIQYANMTMLGRLKTIYLPPETSEDELHSFLKTMWIGNFPALCLGQIIPEYFEERKKELQESHELQEEQKTEKNRWEAFLKSRPVPATDGLSPLAAFLCCEFERYISDDLGENDSIVKFVKDRLRAKVAV